MSGNILVPANIIEVRQGDTFNINFHLKKCCKDYDLTGTSIVMTVRNRSDKTLIFTKNAEDVDLTHGRMMLPVYPSDTENLDVGDYDCIIRAYLPSGEVHTLFPDDPKKIATFRVTEQV